MFGDLNLGKVTKLDPDSKHPNLNVQGAVTATQVIFRDFGSNNADEDIVMRRKVLEAHQEKSADFLFLSSTAEVNPITESVESQSVGFFRQVGLESQGDGSISISEVFTVKLGVDDHPAGGGPGAQQGAHRYRGGRGLLRLPGEGAAGQGQRQAQFRRRFHNTRFAS